MSAEKLDAVTEVPPPINTHFDLGALVYEDSQSFAGLTEKDIEQRSRDNFTRLFKHLFDLKRQQKAKAGGDDGEILEYTKALWSVELPEPKIVTPRQKPAPKEKPKTKWEKFREEKGLPTRKKRSRLVFDPITNDWVPRWGPNSKKKIEAKHEWLLEDKPKHIENGVDPFT
jgi:regulator of ribosome biosynthesis